MVFVRTRMFSLHLSKGLPLSNLYIADPVGYVLLLYPVLFLDLYNHPSLFGSVDNFLHILKHLGTWYSNKISPAIRQEFVIPTDDLSNHVTDEVLVFGTLLEGPFGDTPHHY